VFYESPKRLVEALEAVAEAFPWREVAVCRELTKLHEEVLRGRAAEVRDAFAARAGEPGGIRGEVCDVRLDKVGRNAIWGHVEQIRVSSPARLAPDCPHFGQCGG